MIKDLLQGDCPDDIWAALKRAARAECDALLQCEKLRADLAEAERLLKWCGDQFAFYADEHRKKGATEKAATNQRFADAIRAFLSRDKEAHQ